MNALIFTLKTKPNFKLNCSYLTPNRLTSLSLEKIAMLRLGTCKNAPLVTDYFTVSGTDTSNIVFRNSSIQLDYIGQNMSFGQIIIEKAAGDFVGANMHGGSIVCRGSANDRVGDQMRRGLILIEGDVGDYTASRMIAGTIGVLGCTGAYTGFAMKRGTILLAKPAQLHATMQSCGIHTLGFLRILLRSFAHLSPKFALIAHERVQRFAGDLSGNGNGEVLVFHPQAIPSAERKVLK
ncbi:MAG: formylmethanofuran dehydrogenase subunit C [Methylophilaceae bacterium]